MPFLFSLSINIGVLVLSKRVNRENVYSNKKLTGSIWMGGADPP